MFPMVRVVVLTAEFERYGSSLRVCRQIAGGFCSHSIIHDSRKSITAPAAGCYQYENSVGGKSDGIAT